MADVPPIPDYEAVKRINIGLLGVDVLILKGDKAIRKALDESPDLVSPGAALDDDFSKMPWYFRYIFPSTRFYSTEFDSMFLPLREKGYDASRSYLDRNFTPGAYDIAPFAKEAADVLLSDDKEDQGCSACSGKDQKSKEEKLGDIFAQAMASRFFPDGQRIPDAIIQHVRDSVGQITEGANPLKNSRGRREVKPLYRWFYDNLVSKEPELPDVSVPDVSHAIFPPTMFGPMILTEMVKDPHQDLIRMLARLVPTKQVIRMSKTDSTLAGLLPADKPIIGKKTIVLVDIEIAAWETMTTAYVFGSGSSKRRCAAEPALMEFLEAVQKELQSRV